MLPVVLSAAADLPGQAVGIYNLISADIFDRVPTLRPRIDRLAGARSGCVNRGQAGWQSRSLGDLK